MKNSEQFRVLVTAVGTVNGSAVIDELRKYKKGSIYIIGANSTPKEYIVNSKYVDEYYVFPSAVEAPEYYLSYVVKFCVDHKVDHIICFIDEEVVSFARNKEVFDIHNIRLCLADYNTISICHYKDRFTDWVEENIPEIAIRRYTDFEKISDSSFPIFVKPVEGRASIGCRAVENREGLCSFLQETNNAKGYIVQEKLTGNIVGVDILRNRSFGQILLIQKKELMRNANGCGTVVEIIDDPKLREICSVIAEKLDLNGLVNAEFFMTPNGPKIIEINPRLPAGTSFSCLAGGNTVVNTLLIADNKPCEYHEIETGKIYARRYETYEM